MNELEELIKCKKDFSYFAKKYLKVMHPKHGLVNFKLHPFQENKVYPCFENKQFIIIKKFRQAGLSTLATMYSLWKIMFFVDYKVVMLSITDRDSKNLMSMVKRAWENLPDFMRCPTKEYSQHAIALQTGSEIRCGTPKMGRGYSVNLIIIDEAAFIENMDEVWKGIFPAISAAGNKAKVFAISTVNGLGNWYAKTYHDSLSGASNFYALDLDYTEHPEYNNEEYVKTMKTELGPRGWDQEVLGIFLSSSDTFIKPEIIRNLQVEVEKYKIPHKKLYKDNLWIWVPPRLGRSYLLCADVAEGLGSNHDSSTFHIIDNVNLEQVCEFKDNTISTYEFAKLIDEIGKHYNNATVVVENNSLGEGVLQRLYHDLDYENIYFGKSGVKKTKMGFTMTKNRPLVLNTFGNMIENGHVKIKSQRLVSEIQTLEYNSKIRRPEARSGCHDDLITALAMGLFVRNNIFNSLPLGTDSETEEEDFQPSFNPKYDKIVKSSDIEDTSEQFERREESYEILVSSDYEDDDAILKEFGW